ncbi:MAG: GHKL domain-containing protein [Lachnospiraceae bacterium]|nr:GHKL domain-containing protein [Ruminococcus sp.]MCM1274085.1 GHKL domain-containing protein [Lachnospiraceae bacterium]
MLSFIAGTVFTETVVFLTYILICAALFKPRFGRRATVLAFCAAAAVIAAVQAVVMPAGEETLMLTLLPLTAYLPFSALLYFLSDCGVFETAAVCSVGTLGVLVLRSLHKTLSLPVGTGVGRGAAKAAAVNAVVLLAAAALVFIAFRFIGKPFRFCVVENRRNGLLLSVPTAMVFLTMLWFLNSTTDATVLFFTTLTAFSVFLIIAKLLGSTAELIRAKRAEREMSEHMEIQRRGYERLARKMETGREYRHDMRHHLAVIEGLARQGDCGRIAEYAGKINESLGEVESAGCCKNPELNAVLSEYFARAEKAGCKILQSIALPAKLPFEAGDVCIVLANAVENAINACAKLPEGERYINISAECADNRRLFVAVKNPCADAPEFDENGLPAVDGRSEEHGIGLRSVNRVAEKYNGFLRCKVENGEFVFRAALFCEESAPQAVSSRNGSVPKRAVSSLLGLGLGTLLVLNIAPSAAEAASSLLSVNIRTIRSLNLGWGSNSVSAEAPEFDGEGSDELNSAVKSCADEAKERFLWYFNRRYNGYVAEDMRYTVIRDDEKYFIARFNVTINAGGSLDYSRWINFDKGAGRVLELADMFGEGVDYVSVLSAEILEQMRYKNEHEDGRFFVEGDDAFTAISEDADFYIDGFDRLVIVFDEYEVAPGFMGSPEFIIPKNLLEETAR